MSLKLVGMYFFSLHDKQTNNIISIFFTAILPLELSEGKIPFDWITSFFDIHNVMLQLTNSSDTFCLALVNKGLIHFAETELQRLTPPISSSTQVRVL